MMNLMRRDWFGDMVNEMSRFQEEFGRAFGRAGVPFGNGGGRFAGVGPAANVWANEQNVYAEFDLPGVDPTKLDVAVTEGNRLTVQGERPVVDVPNAVWHRHERGHGAFTRALTLPTLVDADKVEAKYEHGVLRLTLPKAEAAKPRKIAVKA